MKNRKICLPLLIFLVFILISGNAAAQTDETEGKIINPEKLLRTADEEIFKRFSFSFDFSEDQGYVNEFPNPVTVHQYYIYDGEGSDMLMTMQPSAAVVRTTNKRLGFEQVREREFHVTYSVVRREDMPEGGGGICWIGYSNVLKQTPGHESGVIFYPGDQAYFFHYTDGVPAYDGLGDLSDLDPSQTSKFDIIRLAGVTYVYVNGKFRFSYEDGIVDTVSFEGGAELHLDGTRVRCAFDDFSMRIK